ncbi:UNVERIFIED_CONTAM: staphostatin A, partial [Acinetobacter lwoffii]
IDLNKYYTNSTLLNMLEVNLFPKNFDKAPLKFVFNETMQPSYYCTKLDTNQRTIVLTEKSTLSIVIEICIINQNKIIFNLNNINAIGSSPKMIFER